MTMNYTVWAGLGIALALFGAAVVRYGAWILVSNLHGLGLVLGGLACAYLIGFPWARIRSSLARLGSLFFSPGFPSVDEAVSEVLRLARLAQAGGGVLALANESRDFAGGFLHRAVLVAVATGESQETGRIMANEIRRARISGQEDVNVLRTIGTLAPMFGLLGTLLGMMRVMSIMSDPTKVGPAMALALSSALYGIALANFVCVPAAAQMRLRSMEEALVLEVLLEGVLDLMAAKPPYLVGMHLASYSETRRTELTRAAPAAGPVPV